MPTMTKKLRHNDNAMHLPLAVHPNELLRTSMIATLARSSEGAENPHSIGRHPSDVVGEVVATCQAIDAT